ncbi:MAG: hypothetical protein V8T86_15975 [Victivallis sp.]
MRNLERLRPVGVKIQPDALQIQHDLRDILEHVVQRVEFMLRAVNAHRADRRSLQRREQNPPQRISERMTVSALKRRRDELGVILGRARIIDDDRLRHRKTDRSSHIFPPT